MKKAALLAMAVMTALVITGCAQQPQAKQDNTSSSSSSVAVEEKAPLQSPVVVDSGFYVDSLDTVHAWFIVENPNESTTLQSTSMQLAVKDADGNILDADSEFKIGDLLPGERFAASCIMIDAPADSAASADAKAVYARNSKAKENPITLVSSNITESGVAGEVMNTGDESVSAVTVGVICRDESGNVVSAGYEDITNIASGASSYFNVRTYGEFASYEVYPHVYVW